METQKQISIEDLLKQYQRYIIKVASTLTKDNYIKEELIQEASIGLWKAYINFNEAEGSLHSYLISYIRGSMLNYLTNSTRTIKISANVIHETNRTEGKEIVKTISIDKENDEGHNLSETISIEEEDNSMDDQQELVRALLKQYLSKLKPKYQTILKLRYMEEKTIIEIGAELGISRQAVDQQLELAIHQLQKAFGVQQKRIKGERVGSDRPRNKK
jgi:RNA polymerase sigma factor (sigma-70 family)